MHGLENILISAFGAVSLTWAALSVYVLADRGLYDLRRRSVDAAHDLLDPRLLDSGQRDDQLSDILAGLSRRTIERIAADASTPPALARAFAVSAASGDRSKRLVRRASSHRTELGRWRRVAALRILARAGHADALPLLSRAVIDRDPELRGAAVAILGSIEDEGAAKVLLEALRLEAYAPSRIATHLESFPLPIDHLIRPLLADGKPVVRFWAVTLLGRYGRAPGSATEMVGLADDPDPNVRAAVAETLGSASRCELGDETIRRLVGDPVWFVRAHAARSAGLLRLDSEAPRIAALLADEQWWVRAAAKNALESFGADASAAVVSALDHPDAFARNGAAEVLQNSGFLGDLLGSIAWASRPTPSSIALLQKIFDEGGPLLRAAALERIEPQRRRRVESLLAEAAPRAEVA